MAFTPMQVSILILEPYRDVESEITPEDLGLLEPDELLTGKGSFEQKVHAFSRRLITAALSAAKGNQAQAGRDLGLSYHQFRYYLKKYKITSSAQK